jgi:hypothetical protein
LTRKIFEPYEREKIGRNFSGGSLPLRRETCNRGEFFGFRSDLPVFFGAKARTAQKFPARNV